MAVGTIRVAVIADTEAHAGALARLTREVAGLIVVSVGARSTLISSAVDVLVADRLDPEDLEQDGPPVVLIRDDVTAPFPPHRAIKAVLPPDVSSQELYAGILAAHQEFIVLTPSQARRWLAAPEPVLIREEVEPAVESLTPRELQVLRLLADGLGNKEIAGKLAISDHTAKFHVAQILAKFGAVSRAEAVAIGLRRGLLPV